MKLSRKKSLIQRRGTLKQRRKAKQSRREVGPMTRAQLWGIGQEVTEKEAHRNAHLIKKAIEGGWGDVQSE